MLWAVVAAVAAGLAIATWRATPAFRLRVRAGPAPKIEQVDPGFARQRILGAGAIAASGLLLGGGLGWWGIPVALGLGVAGYLTLGRLLPGEAARRRERLVAQLPQVCDLLAVCLDAGLPLRSGVQVLSQAVAAPLGGLLAEVAAKVGLGADEAKAWSELAQTEPALAPLSREVARTVGSGIALSGALRSLGVDARRAAVVAAEVRAKRVGVRSVLPLMVCFLPAFLLLGVVPIIGGVAQNLFR